MEKLGLAETIESLKAQGYVEDFNLRQNCNEPHAGKFKQFADEFEIESVFRFDEMSDPSDQAILYAVRSKKNDMKGTLVNSFGLYSEPVTNEILEALHHAEQLRLLSNQ